MKAIIKTDEENKVALAFLERLMDGDPEITSEEGKLLSLLADAIGIFEKKYDNALSCHGASGGSGNCPHFTPHKGNADWEEAFDQTFPEFGYPRGTRNDRMKSFIRQTIALIVANERARLREKVEEMKRDELGDPNLPFYGTSGARSFAKAYNTAIEKVLTFLEGDTK